MSETTQQLMVNVAFFPLLVLSVLAFLATAGWLWKKGKSVEAMLVWVSLWLYLIALILLFR